MKSSYDFNSQTVFNLLSRINGINGTNGADGNSPITAETIKNFV